MASEKLQMVTGRGPLRALKTYSNKLRSKIAREGMVIWRSPSGLGRRSDRGVGFGYWSGQTRPARHTAVGEGST